MALIRGTSQTGGGGVVVSSDTPQPIGTATAGVSADAARADHVHALPTGLVAAPDTGWTADGDGAAAISGGVATVTVTAAQTSGVLRRTMINSPHLPAIELIARVTVTTVPVSGGYFAGIGVLNEDIPANGTTARGLIVQPQSDGSTYLFVNTAGSWGVVGSASSPASITSGNLWLRLVYSAGGVTAFAGSGATIPSTWTTIVSTAPQHLLSGPGVVTQTMLFVGRAGGGSGDYVCDIEDIQWRSLLGAPT